MFLRFLQTLFPSLCVSCGYLERPLCRRCFNCLEYDPQVRVIQGVNFELKICSTMRYKEGTILEKLLHPFKYKHQASLFRVFVPLMREALKLLQEPEQVILTPVPLHPSRERERGYNQAFLLANWIGRQTGAPVMHLLKRVKDTGSQAMLQHREERQKNMMGAFEALARVPPGRTILLVDDILTTGSTLMNCAEALRQAGAEKVLGLTLADR